MRPTWLILSLLAHATAVGTAVGLAVHAGGRLPHTPPRVDIRPTFANAPVPPPAEPVPPVREEAAVVDALLPEVRVAEPIEPPPAEVAGEWRRPTRSAPSLQRVVLPVPPPAEPAPAVPVAAEPSATTEAVRRADNEPPTYPERERRLGHEGTVVLAVAVDARGDVVRVELKTPSPHVGLNREALRAVRRWRFEPARRHGQPVASETEVEVEFRLRAGS